MNTLHVPTKKKEIGINKLWKLSTVILPSSNTEETVLIIYLTLHIFHINRLSFSVYLVLRPSHITHFNPDTRPLTHVYIST